MKIVCHVNDETSSCLKRGLDLDSQVGDQLDRGGNEVQILYWLERLQKQAEQHGGSLHILTG